MKKLFSLIVFSLSVFFAAAQTDAKVAYFFGDRFSISIPGDVNSMTNAQVEAKYHKSKDATTNFYGDADMSFSIVFSEVANNVKEDDMVKHKTELLAGIKAKYTLKKEEVRIINNHKVIIVSFFSDVPDGKVLNEKIFAVANGKLVAVTFNSTEAELEKRNPQIEASINSIVIK